MHGGYSLERKLTVIRTIMDCRISNAVSAGPILYRRRPQREAV